MKTVKLKNSGAYVMQGNQACAEGALAAECNFFAAYPITPATEVAEYMSGKLIEGNGYFVQMEDEIGSISALIGASLAGGRAMTATSGPGYSLMQEGLGAAIGMERPCVICDVMRGGPSSGQATASSQMDIMQVRYGTHGDYEILALCPSSAQEAFDMTVRAFNMAFKYMMPVIVLMDEIVAHTRERVLIPETVDLFDDHYEGICETYHYKPDENHVPPRINFFEGHRCHFDTNLRDDRGYRAGGDADVAAKNLIHLRDKLLLNMDDIASVHTWYDDDEVDVAVIAFGSVSRSAMTAVESARAKGLKVSYMKLDSIWPVPEKEIIEFCNKAKKVLVPEMNIGRYVREIQRLVGINKAEPLMSLGGRMPHPNTILAKIEEMI